MPKPTMFTAGVENAKRPLLKAAFAHLFPIPQIPDPNWVDPGDGSSAPLVPQHNDNDWVKVCIQRWITDQVLRYERGLARRTAEGSVERDEDLVEVE
jgi:hypothetical protein